jgi:hypothetical protein
VTQTVRLIRSKGVGVVFVTQTPQDVPREVLAQLGSRVQHALRAFTPEDAKALRATASTFPTSPYYQLEELLTTVGTGEAVVTVLSEDGAPTPVAWTRVHAPRSEMGPAPQQSMDQTVAASALYAKYGTPVDRDSAYERLTARLAPAAHPAAPEPSEQPVPAGTSAPAGTGGRKHPGPVDSSTVERVLASPEFRSMARSAATVLGREITRSLFGVGQRRRLR